MKARAVARNEQRGAAYCSPWVGGSVRDPGCHIIMRVKCPSPGGGGGNREVIISGGCMSPANEIYNEILLFTLKRNTKDCRSSPRADLPQSGTSIIYVFICKR